MKNYTVESVLKSDPEIRHLLDVACPLANKGKIRIKGILIVCKSITIRKAILDLLKLKLNFESYKHLELNFNTKEGDLLTRVTQVKPKDFILCDEEELKINDTVRKLLSRVIDESTCEIQLGKGPSAKSINLDLPESTFVFSCEKETPAKNFLSKYCDHVICLSDYKIEKLCEPIVSALFNEEKIHCPLEIIKSIVRRNEENIDLCFRSVKRLSQYVELNKPDDRIITRSILEKVEGNIYYDFTLEYIRELKRLNIAANKIIRMFEEHESDLVKHAFLEIKELLHDIRDLTQETTKELKSLSSSDQTN